MKTMTPEERDEQLRRQMDFLAASQAQHDARMAEISKTLDQNSRQIAENSRQISQLADFILRIGRIVEEQGEQARRTDDRLNTLINVVDRYFSNGRH